MVQAIVPLTAFAGDIVNIRFRGVTGNEFASDISIDDIGIDNTTGINENEFAGNVLVYPNPSNGDFNIVMNGLEKEELNMTVYNVEGKTLQQNNIPVVNSYKTTLDMRSYSKGIYFLEIKGTHGVKRFKLTVI